MSASSSPAQRRTPPKRTQGHLGPTTLSGKTQYLVLYNLISFLLWVSILLRLLLNVATTFGWRFVIGLGLFERDHTPPSTASTAFKLIANVYPSTFHILSFTQSLAALEIIHAAVGLVRTSIVTTSMQVASRLLLVWGILTPFGSDLLVEGTARKLVSLSGIAGLVDRLGVGRSIAFNQSIRWNQAAYLGLLIAWTATEFIRYLYFVYVLGSDGAAGGVPKLLGFLRYNTFFILYPLGIGSECWLIYHAIPFAKQIDQRLGWFFWAVLAIYVPGSYILYTHMMTQRRRIIKGKKKSL